MTNLFSHADHAALMKRRQSLIKQRRRAEYAHGKRAKIERELRDTTTACLRLEAGRAA